MKKKEHQTMMILWKWEDLTHINEKSWETSNTFSKQDYLNNIEKGKGLFYDEYPVEVSEQCPDAKLIIASIYQVPKPFLNTDGNKNEALLDALIEKYLPKKKRVPLKNKKGDVIMQSLVKHKFMLFLHRGNNYSELDIDRLFKKFGDRISNIFLFANGRDYVYYKIGRIGLLDDLGFFHQGVDRFKKESVIIFDEENKIIKQPFFDRLWQHYSIEFETKVYQLKEELCECWLPFLLPDQPEDINKEELMKKILANNKGLLYYRLKSFLGHYNMIKIKEETNFDSEEELYKEIDSIIRFEKKDKKSYLFDDCIVNLENQKAGGDNFVSDEYDEIKQLMESLFFLENKNAITKDKLCKLADKLNYLVKIIPGVIELK